MYFARNKSVRRYPFRVLQCFILAIAVQTSAVFSADDTQPIAIQICTAQNQLSPYEPLFIELTILNRSQEEQVAPWIDADRSPGDFRIVIEGGDETVTLSCLGPTPMRPPQGVRRSTMKPGERIVHLIPVYYDANRNLFPLAKAGSYTISVNAVHENKSMKANPIQMTVKRLTEKDEKVAALFRKKEAVRAVLGEINEVFSDDAVNSFLEKCKSIEAEDLSNAKYGNWIKWILAKKAYFSVIKAFPGGVKTPEDQKAYSKNTNLQTARALFLDCRSAPSFFLREEASFFLSTLLVAEGKTTQLRELFVDTAIKRFFYERDKEKRIRFWKRALGEK